MVKILFLIIQDSIITVRFALAICQGWLFIEPFDSFDELGKVWRRSYKCESDGEFEIFKLMKTTIF